MNGSSAGRITPAHAGSMLPYSEKQVGNQDHPRACGEHMRTDATLPVIAGSPPRMRGA